jgi:hypothetical protein
VPCPAQSAGATEEECLSLFSRTINKCAPKVRCLRSTLLVSRLQLGSQFAGPAIEEDADTATTLLTQPVFHEIPPMN